MIVKVRIIFLWLIFALAIPAIAEDKEVLESIERYICQGRDVEALKLVDQVYSKKDVGLEARLLSLQTEAGFAREFDKTKFVDSGTSHVNRMMAAFTLLRSMDYKPETAQRLVDFESSDPLLGSYKKVIYSNLTGDRREALRFLIDAYRESPNKDLGILSQIFFVAFGFKDYERVLGQFVSDIKNIPEDNPFRYLMLSHLEFLPPNSGDRIISNSYLKQAFEMCPIEDIALTYAFGLKESHRYSDLESLLRSQMSKRPRRNPYFDFLLGEVLIKKDKKEEAALYFDNARKRKTFLTAEDVKLLETEYNGAKRNRAYVVGILLLVLIVGAMVIFFKRGKKHKLGTRAE